MKRRIQSRLLVKTISGSLQPQLFYLNEIFFTSKTMYIVPVTIPVPILVLVLVMSIPVSKSMPMSRGRHLKCYSVIAITLRYVFALSYNVLTLWRNLIASISYRSEHIGAVFASYSYRSKLIDQRYCFC